MKTENEIVPVEVFSGSFTQAEMVKSLLENSEIEVFLIDELAGTLVPWIVSPGGVNPVRVIVADKDYHLAKTLVEEYENNQKK